MGKVELELLKRPPVFRKIAMGTWKTVGDPSVYGEIQLDMTKALEHLKVMSEKNSLKLTPTHLVGKALSLALKERPEINGIIRGSRIYLRKNVSLFFQVNVPGSGDKIKDANLSGVVLHEVEKMSLVDIAKNLNAKASKVKSGDDLELKKSFGIIKYIPWCLMRGFLNLTSFLIYGLNLDFSFLGLPKDPFGSAMITSFGSMGVEKAFAPLVPYSRVPLLFAVGAIGDKVVAIDGQVCIRPILTICATFDHRFMDGVHASHVVRLMQQYFKEPERYLV